MAFNITQFWNFKPYLPFRYKVEIGIDGLNDISSFTFFVQKVKLPVIEAGESNAIPLGNGILQIPTYNISKRTLEIVFEETDNLDVLKLIDILAGAMYCGVALTIPIKIYNYDSSMATQICNTTYMCRLKSYEEPTFAMAGGVNVVTTNMSFLVDAIMYDVDKITTTIYKDNKNKNKTEVFNDELIAVKVVNKLSLDKCPYPQQNPLVTIPADLEEEITGLYKEIEDKAKDIVSELNNIEEKLSKIGLHAINYNVFKDKYDINNNIRADLALAFSQRKLSEKEYKDICNQLDNILIYRDDIATLKENINILLNPPSESEDGDAGEGSGSSGGTPAGDVGSEGGAGDSGGSAEGSGAAAATPVATPASTPAPAPAGKSPGNEDPSIAVLNEMLKKSEAVRTYVYINHHKAKSDVPTVGIGWTFRDALTNIDITLKNKDTGEEVTKKGLEWHNYFTEIGYDALPNGFGGQNGDSPTTANWTLINPVNSLKDEITKNYLNYAKKITDGRYGQKYSISWNDSTKTEKGLIFDAGYNGLVPAAFKALHDVREQNLSLDTKEGQEKYIKIFGETAYKNKKDSLEQLKKNNPTKYKEYTDAFIEQQAKVSEQIAKSRAKTAFRYLK